MGVSIPEISYRDLWGVEGRKLHCVVVVVVCLGTCSTSLAFLKGLLVAYCTSLQVVLFKGG